MAKESANQEHHYSQVNNPEEQQFKKLGITGFLESCGPTASVMCLAVLGAKVDIVCPGEYSPQPESTAMSWFHDSRNFPAMEFARSGINLHTTMNNRIPQYYSPMVKSVFKWKCEFRYMHVDEMVSELKLGNSVQACLIDPGHFISLVDYDRKTDEIIYNDPWPSRTGNINGGFNERETPGELGLNLNTWGVVYYANGGL